MKMCIRGKAPPGPRRTCASCRNALTAHTLVSSSVSTTGQPPRTSGEARGSGSGTPGGGRRNCRLSASATCAGRQQPTAADSSSSSSRAGQVNEDGRAAAFATGLGEGGEMQREASSTSWCGASHGGRGGAQLVLPRKTTQNTPASGATHAQPAAAARARRAGRQARCAQPRRCQW